MMADIERNMQLFVLFCYKYHHFSHTIVVFFDGNLLLPILHSSLVFCSSPPSPYSQNLCCVPPDDVLPSFSWFSTGLVLKMSGR